MRRPAHPDKPPSSRHPAQKGTSQCPRQTAKQPAKSTSPAQSSTDQAQLAMTDEQFLQGLMTANLHDAENQLELLLQGRTATDHVPKGLSTLSQFLLHRQQALDNPHPEQWSMANWHAVRTNAGRLSLIRKYQRPFASLKEPERQRCARYLLSLFPDSVPCKSVGESEFFGFVDCILQSRLQYERHIQAEAQIFDDLEENVRGYRFNCVGFPGPPKASQNWHLWAHATTREGACGILAVGKVLPADHGVAGLDPTKDSFSFYGRSMNAPQRRSSATCAQVLSFHKKLLRHCVCGTHPLWPCQRQKGGHRL